MKNILYFRIIRTTPDGTEMRGGGAAYENNFMEILKQNPNFNIQTENAISPVNRGFSFFKIIFAQFKFKRIVKNQGEKDIIFFMAHNFLFLMYTMFWLRLSRRKTKIVAFYHHPAWASFHGIRRIILKHFQVKFLRRCHFTVFACAPTLDKNKYLSSKPRHKIVLIENAIPRIETPKVEKVPNRVCCISRFNKQKGIAEMIHAFGIAKSKIPNFDAQLVGEYSLFPKYAGKVKKLIKKYNLENNVTLCGGIPNDEKNKILASSQFFVFPSHFEGYGLVIFEAMQFGLPVIAWNVSAMPYSVKNEQNGLLIKHNNIPAFAAAIVRLYHDKNLLARLSVGARKSFEKTQSPEEFKQKVKEFGELVA